MAFAQTLGSLAYCGVSDLQPELIERKGSGKHSRVLRHAIALQIARLRDARSLALKHSAESRQLYFLTAASMAPLALARSSGTITG